MTKYEEFRFSDMCQVFSFSLGLSGHLLLNGHNKYRKIHNSPPLSLSSQLNSDAQAIAERVIS